jgi:hypothetical protein
MTLDFQPEYNSDDRRVFGHFCGAGWFQSDTTTLKEPDAFVVAVILGSDTTSIKRRETVLIQPMLHWATCHECFVSLSMGDN